MLRTVATYTTAPEAYIAQGLLSQRNIPSFVLHEHHVWANWMLSQALGGVKLQVPDPFFDEARAVLFTATAGDSEPESESELFGDGEQAACCPSCGSSQLVEQKRSRRAALIALIMLHLPLPYSGRGVVCGECGHHWRATTTRPVGLVTLLLVSIMVATMGYLIMAGGAHIACQYGKTQWCERYWPF